MTATAEFFRQLEQRLLDAETSQSRTALEELLAPDFREFGSSGEIHTQSAILSNLRTPGAMTFTLDDFVSQELSATVALNTYRITARNPVTNRTSNSLRSTLWRQCGHRWQATFHQGTRIPDHV